MPLSKHPGGLLPPGFFGATSPRAGLLALVLGLTACGSLVRDIQPPEIELVGLQFTGVELNRQTFRLSLDVTNPNSIPVPVRALSYQLQLAGGAFADGNSEERFTLPANGTQRIRLNVGTDLLGTLTRISNLLKGSGGAMDYEISGDMHVDLPLVKPIPFRRSGEIALKME